MTERELQSCDRLRCLRPRASTWRASYRHCAFHMGLAEEWQPPCSVAGCERLAKYVLIRLLRAPEPRCGRHAHPGRAVPITRELVEAVIAPLELRRLGATLEELAELD